MTSQHPISAEVRAQREANLRMQIAAEAMFEVLSELEAALSEYHLDGQTMYAVINKIRAALALYLAK